MNYMVPGSYQDEPPPEQAASGLSDPRTRSALLQFGLSLMTPQWGGAASNIGQAVGSAGEQVGRIEKMDQAAEEAASKQDLRAAQSDAAYSRARAAEESASVARTRTELQAQALKQKDDHFMQQMDLHNKTYEMRLMAIRERIAGAKTTEERKAAEFEEKKVMDEHKKGQDALRNQHAADRLDVSRGHDAAVTERQNNSNAFRANQDYNKAEKAWRDERIKILNSDKFDINPTSKAKKEQAQRELNEGFKPREDWIRERQPEVAQRQGYGGTTQEPQPLGVGATQTPQQTATPPTPTGSGAPPAPTDPAQRKPNTTYKTPKGDLKWTGTGWVNP